jgi:hypothetical protein
MRTWRKKLGLWLLAGALALGLLPVAWVTGAGSSGAQDGTRDFDLQMGWNNFVWTGATDTDPATALSCIEGNYAIAYRFTAVGQTFQRYVPADTALSNMTNVDQYDSLLVLVTASGVQCQGMPVSAAAPTPTPTAPTPSPSPSPAPGAGLTRDNPVPFGQTLTAPPGWDITVSNVDWDAWPEVHAENMFNDPPEEGYRMVMVTVRAKNVQAGDETDTIWDSDFEMVGSRNIVYTTFERSCGVIPDDLWAEVFPGGTVEGNVCFQAGINETNLLLIAALTWSNADRRYFALQ